MHTCFHSLPHLVSPGGQICCHKTSCNIRPAALAHSSRWQGDRRRHKHNSLITACTGNSDQSQAPPPVSEAVPTDRRALLAGGAVAAGAVVAVLSRAKSPVTFTTLEKGAVDLDMALSNGKPTVIEFYASWCEICRELLPVSAKLEEDFQKDINFVALNIDNTKWTSEVQQYRVRGVPHFVFLDSQAKQKTAAVGRVPQQILEDNARALAAGAKLPYVGAAGKTSLPDAGQGTPTRQSMPRDHA